MYDKVSHVDVNDSELWVHANVIDKKKVLHVDAYDSELSSSSHIDEPFGDQIHTTWVLLICDH